ncbi:MAG: arsenate reductase (glutaredoxin) [Wenzhouxiangellaceae bacterium]|nr:arsenate reductase (glutaredoxin) [Wenzhouxiangellaceae bacterium]
MRVIIHHNPRCSKSRATLALLREHGIKPEIVPYLDQPPSVEQLKQLTRMLGLRAVDLLRSGEPAWLELGLDAENTDEETVFAQLAAHPILIQRPIVVVGERARIGRPPEAVLEILTN